MRRFDDPRHAARLAVIDEIAGRHLDRLGLSAAVPEAFRVPFKEPSPIEAAALAALGTIPDEEVPAVRIALLRQVAESELGTPDSSHGVVRESLAGRGPALGAADLALELALCRFAMDLGSGISLGWMRVSLLDRSLDDLEGMELPAITDELRAEAESLVELFADQAYWTEAAVIDRRFRLLLLLQRSVGGALPASAFDSGDAFGEDMTTLVRTDAELARSLGVLLPLAAKATSVLPDRRQRAVITSLGHGADEAVRGAVARCLQRLLTAPLTPQGAGFVTVRPTNQRLARAAIWLVPELLPARAAALLGELGVRMGTSGKRDNQARDAALAGTSAALLGEIDGDESVASLARMLAQVRNKPVRKQVERALAAAAARAGTTVDELVDRSLPSYGIGADGRRSVGFDSWSAEIELEADGRVRVAWIDGGAEPRDEPPRSLRDRAPGEVTDVSELADDIRETLGDERRRLELLLAEERRWPVAEWRRRFLEHPIGKVDGRRLIWRFTDPSGTSDAMPQDGDPIDESGRPMRLHVDATVELWHPVDASDESVDRWRDLLVERRIIQPFKQAFRETYRVDARAGTDAVLDTRFADRPLAYGQMRALMGARGWTAPMLGPFDQGDRSVAFRDFAHAGLRAELGHVPAGIGDPRERVEFARSGSLRFTSGSADRRLPVLLADVPPRLLSEVLRDVDLFTSVPELMRKPTSGSDADGSPSVAMRAEAIRRLLPRLPFARHASVLGLWLRVDGATGAHAISLASAAVVRLPDEEAVEVRLPEPLPDVGYVPFDDEVLRDVLAAAAVIVAGA